MTDNTETGTAASQDGQKTTDQAFPDNQPEAGGTVHGDVSDQTQNQQQGNSEQFRSNQADAPPPGTGSGTEDDQIGNTVEGANKAWRPDEPVSESEGSADQTETDAHVGSAQGGS